MATNTFILDLGSQNTKVGSSTAVAPTVVPSLCGAPRFPSVLRPAVASALGLDVVESHRDSFSSSYFGRDAMSRRALLRLTHPVQRGTASEWSPARALVEHAAQLAFTEHTSIGDETVLGLVESPFSSRTQRARLVELCFEGGDGDEGHEGSSADRLRHRAKGHRGEGTELALCHRPFTGVFCGVAPLLALYATGVTTGVAIEVGHDTISTAAAIAGTSLPAALHREDGCAGDAMTTLFELLLRQGGAFDHAAASSERQRCSLGTGSTAERELLREVKEATCTVSPSPLPACVPWGEATATMPKPSAEEEDARTVAYTLPDGTELAVSGTARRYASECLFTPSLAGSECDGVGELLIRAITRVGPDLGGQLRSHVVVSGGASQMRGFAQRCFRVVQAQTTTGDAVRVIAPAERASTPWYGVSLLSQLSTFRECMVVSRNEYAEAGASVLHTRIFT